MFKCEWLKKLLGLRKKCCSESETDAPINSESISDPILKTESEPLTQMSEEVLKQPRGEDFISQ
jgi:hypothetical protein